MPLKNYGVLAGRVLDTRAEGGSGAPHFQIRVGAAGVDFRSPRPARRPASRSSRPSCSDPRAAC